ncbi:MAG TPA: mandelate racemase, partial [Actinomycetota bacterium]|nr:mandelate racemase [Actinomycetota bacterium]
MATRRPDAAVERVDVDAYTVPTDAPEADGTLTWDQTTVVVVHVSAGGASGIGFTYGPSACATLVRDALASVVVGLDAMDVPAAWAQMVQAIRNIGRPGVASMAIAAVDTALWDLKARLLDISLATLLGRVRTEVPVYASGGFTSYREDDLGSQLGTWVHDWGIPRVKMKVGTGWGTEPERDVERVRVAREAV